MPNNYVLTHTGEELDNAIAKALLLQLPVAPQKNLLINGDFQVWQTETRSITIVNQTTQRVCDMYKIHNISSGGINVTIDNTSGSGLLITPSTTDSNWSIELIYRLKSPLRNTLNGKSVTISYRLGDNIQSNTFVANILPDSEYDITTTISGQGTQTLYYIKLEEGETYTPLISNPYEVELFACQRYYRILKDVSLVSIGRTESGTDNFYLPIHMARFEMYPPLTGYGEVNIQNPLVIVGLGNSTISSIDEVKVTSRVTDVNNDIIGYLISASTLSSDIPTPTTLTMQTITIDVR